MFTLCDKNVYMYFNQLFIALAGKFYQDILESLPPVCIGIDFKI